MTLSYIPSDTNAEGILKAAASGTLPNGKPVIVNTDGTVSVVAETSINQGVGNYTVFESATSSWNASAYDSNVKRIVIAYSDEGNSQHGTAVVCAVDGTSLTFGTPVVFSSAEVNYISLAFDSSNNKIVIAWHNYVSGTDTGQAIVATVDSSNNSISFGSAATFESGNNSHIGCGFDSTNNKVVIAYKDHSNSNRGTAIVGTVSGTSISFGSAVVFETGASVNNIVMFDSSNDKIVIAYSDQADGDDGKAIVGTVSGTSISFGSSTDFETGGVFGNHMGAAFDTTNNKVVIAYADGNNSAYGTGIVGTVSGTSISFGTPTVFETANSNYINVAFNAAAGKVIIAYQDKGNDNGTGTYVEGTVSSTSISFNSPATFPGTGDRDAIYISVTYDSDQYASVISFRNTDNSSYGTSFSYQSTATVTNLTSENYIGMSSGVVDVNSVAQAAGSSTVFEAANSAYISATFDSNSNKVVIAFRDDGDSGKGKAIVGTVSGTSISFGSAAVFYSGFSNYIVASFDSSNNKVVIAYRDDNNSDYGTAIVGTVSGTNISFGSATVFESARSDYITSTFNSTSGKIVIAYTDKGNSSILTAIVGTVSGTSISFGTAVAVTGNPQGYYNSITSESASSKIVIGYTNGSNSDYGTAVVGTVSNTSISFGTPVVFESATATFSSATFDSTSGKVVIAYTDEGNSSYGTAIVGTVSSTSISFGSATVFESGSSSEFSASFDPLSNSVVVAYRDNGNSNYITFAIGSVSGSSVSFSSPVVFDTAGSEYISSVAYGNEAKVVIAYKDAGNSNYGTAGVIQPAHTSITRGEVPSGSQAITNIIGSVNSIQTGLTAGQSYFVQTDGTIGLTADDPSVFAGTAISATKLIVKT